MTRPHALPLDAGEQPLPRSSRYRIHAAVASGGMGTVYVGSLTGPSGFERRVAIKRAHPHLLRQPETRRMLMREARLASLVDHPNVVGIRDVEELDGELLLIMDYVEGTSLSRLRATASPIPPRVLGRILLDVARGLAAIHDLSSAGDARATIVHRDVSPSNVLVGIDGSSRLTDFGVAKEAEATPQTPLTAAHLRRGKLSYMAPEYLSHGALTPAVDVFALGVVAWETLANRALFRTPNDLETTRRLLEAAISGPSQVAHELPEALDRVVLRALERDPAKRCSAAEWARDLEGTLRVVELLGTHAEVAQFVRERCAESPRARRHDSGHHEAHAASGGRTSCAVPLAIRRSSASAHARVVGRPRAALRRLLVSSRRWAQVALVASTVAATVAFFTRAPPSVERVPVRAERDPASMPREDSFAVSAPRLVSIATTGSLGAPSKNAAPPRTPPSRATRPPALSASEVVARAPAREAPSSVEDGEALTERASAAAVRGDCASAATLYRAALAGNPRYLPARLGLADLAWDGGRRPEGVAIYRALVNEYPPDVLPQRARERAVSDDRTE